LLLIVIDSLDKNVKVMLQKRQYYYKERQVSLKLLKTFVFLLPFILFFLHHSNVDFCESCFAIINWTR